MEEKENFDEYRLLILDNFKKLFKEVEKIDTRLSTIEKEMIEQRVKVGFIGALFGIIGSGAVGLIIKLLDK